MVAATAGVPLGNVYYYFSTKEALTRGVLEARVAELATMFEAIEAAHVGPGERLRAYLRGFEQSANVVVEHGCPYGGLASELAKQPTVSNEVSGLLFQTQLDWLEQQFRGCHEGAAPSHAHQRAVTLLGAIQGACLLAFTMKDASLFRACIRRLSHQLQGDSSS